MPDQQREGEAEPQRILETRVQAWWLAVLAGQAAGAHPVHGTDFKAHVEGDTLVLSGTVPSERDRLEIAAELDHFRGHGVSQVRDELVVVPEVTDERGLLAQTLLAAFETAEQAGFAEGYLEGHAHIRPGLMKVVAPDATNAERAIRSALPEAYWADAERMLGAGRTLLIVTVDETEAFKARQLLGEETRSLETLVLPPEPAAKLAGTRRALEEAGRQNADERDDERAEAGRRSALEQESPIHGR